MTKLVIVTKGCDVKELDAKSVNEDELYKKCNYRKPTDFEMVIEWNVKIGSKKHKIRCYGKKVGKANMENKYDFPPPIIRRFSTVIVQSFVLKMTKLLI